MEPPWGRGTFLWSVLALCLGHLGPCWSTSWGHFGATLGDLPEPSSAFLWPSQGRSWRLVGPSLWGPYGASAGFVGALPGGLLTPLGGHLRALLGRLLSPSCAAPWGFSGPLLGPPWGPYRGALGIFFGLPFGVILGPPWGTLGIFVQRLVWSRLCSVHVLS